MEYIFMQILKIFHFDLLSCSRRQCFYIFNWKKSCFHFRKFGSGFWSTESMAGCSDPPNVARASISSWNDTYVTYMCFDGYGIQGSATVYCNGGVWDSTPNCLVAWVRDADHTMAPGNSTITITDSRGSKYCITYRRVALYLVQIFALMQIVNNLRDLFSQ